MLMKGEVEVCRDSMPQGFLARATLLAFGGCMVVIWFWSHVSCKTMDRSCQITQKREMHVLGLAIVTLTHAVLHIKHCSDITLKPLWAILSNVFFLSLSLLIFFSLSFMDWLSFCSLQCVCLWWHSSIPFSTQNNPLRPGISRCPLLFQHPKDGPGKHLISYPNTLVCLHMHKCMHT